MLQDVHITLELSGKYLRLVDSSKDSELFSQRLHSLRQWTTGPGRNRSTGIYAAITVHRLSLFSIRATDAFFPRRYL